MGASRKFDLDQRLEAYFATLRSPSLREALKRGAGNWQMYAAVTGSAMAMMTSASAQIIGTGIREITTEPIASARVAMQNLASSKNIPLLHAVRLAMAKPDSGERFFNDASVKNSHASQAEAPSISPGGVVPLYSSVSTIQPGELVSIYGNNLASGTATWNGDFPTSLGGTSVEINGKAAYLMYVSPGLINLQAPDETATGTVSVVVTTARGTATSTVTLNQFSPSFESARHKTCSWNHSQVERFGSLRGGNLRYPRTDRDLPWLSYGGRASRRHRCTFRRRVRADYSLRPGWRGVLWRSANYHSPSAFTSMTSPSR